MRKKKAKYFDLPKVISEIDAYINSEINNNTRIEPFVRKDFFNFATGQITCGCCGKKMGAIRSVFHWHIYF